MAYSNFEGVKYGYRHWEGSTGSMYLKTGWESNYLDNPKQWSAQPIAVGSATYQIYGNEYDVMKWMEYRAQQVVKIEDALYTSGRTVMVVKSKPAKSLTTLAREAISSSAMSVAGHVTALNVTGHMTDAISALQKGQMGLALGGSLVQRARMAARAEGGLAAKAVAFKSVQGKRASRFTQDDVVVELSVGQAVSAGADVRVWDSGEEFIKFGDILLWAWGMSKHYHPAPALDGFTF